MTSPIVPGAVQVTPDGLREAAAKVTSIRTELQEAAAAAAGPTGAVQPPGLDEVSAAAATWFRGHAATFQDLSQQMDVRLADIARTLESNADAYTNTEEDNARMFV